MAKRTKMASLPPSDALYSRINPRSLYNSSDMASFTSLEEVERLNASLTSRSLTVDEELAEHLKNREGTLFKQKRVFEEQLPAYLMPLVSDASRLERSLDEASRVAEKVSEKIRAIDVIRKRAVEASQQASAAISLRHSVEGVQKSLKAGLYEDAVQHIATYLQFDGSVVDSETKSIMSAAQEQLLVLLRQQLSQAIASNSISDMTRLTKLFSPLSLFDEGVRHYASYLEKQINTDLATIVNQAQESVKNAAEKGTGEKASYAAAISQLIARSHARLKRAKPILEQAFGASALIHAVLILQPVLTSHCCTLIDDFIKSWDHFSLQNAQIQKAAATAEQSASTFLSLSSYASSTTPASFHWNPLEFTPLLDQLVIICQTIEVHARFLTAVITQGREAIAKELNTLLATEKAQLPKPHILGRRLTEAEFEGTPLASSNADPGISGQSKTGPSAEQLRLEKVKQQIEDYSKKLENSNEFGPLNERMLDLLSQYMKFEQFHMKQSVKYVILQDTNAGEAAKGGLVDDVFFLLKEASNRARATYNANTLCTITNFIDSELNNGYYNELEERSSREALQAARSSASLSSSTNYAGAQTPSARNVLIAVNQLEQTATYIGRLKIDLEEPSKKIFALMPHQVEKILTCCEELSRTESRYRTLIHNQIEQIVEAIKPRFLAVFEIIPQFTFNLSSSQYSQNQINDPLSHQLIQGMSDIIAPIEHVLSNTNTAILASFFLKLLVRSFERHVIKQPFSQLGAEQLDRDIRAFADYFASRTPAGASRDAFHRLSQIAYLLGLDSLDDVQEEWNMRIEKRTETDRPVWALSPNDAKRVLLLRPDFSKEKVGALTLRDK